MVEHPPSLVVRPSPLARRVFLAWWFSVTLWFGALVERELWLASFECHGYETWLICEPSVTLALGGAGVLLLLALGALLAWRGSARVLTVAAVLLTLAGAVVVAMQWPQPPPVPGAKKRLDHF